jgi:WD40 repeat protein/predicted chitinase/cytoskeletal protein RodZ
MIEQVRLLANPFPGLRSFETDENYLFFGRDGQSDEVLTKLRTSRFVAVVGTSGSGKSSLVRAGLLPALFSGHMPSAGSSWRVATFRPGSSPINNLAKALSEVCGADAKGNAAIRLTNIERTLRRSSLGLIEVVSQSKMAPYENLLILADQFEELFRFRKKSTDEHPEDEAAAFVKLLLEAKQPDKSPEEKLPIYVILTMRSDYLGDCAHYWGLPEAINEGQFLIPRMTDDNRREAITGPVIIEGGSITAPLVNRLLNDVGDDPAQLPILQHALMRTWDYWKSRGQISEAIGISDYEQIGGMSQALSNHADEAFLALSPELQKVAEKLFKALTEKEADNREGRRPATVGEIAAAAEAGEEQVETVIESFRSEGRSFLMPPPTVPLTSETLIDISHESLIRGWQRLRVWVDREAQAARQYVRLADTAALFPEQQGYLRDPELQVNLKWREENKPTRAWAERYHPGFEKAIAYLDASKANRDTEIAAKEREHKEKVEQDLRHAEAIATEQRRRVKQLRWGVLLLSLLLVGMLAATVVAFHQKREEVRQRDRAENALKTVEVEKNNAQKSQREAVAARKVAEDALGTAKQERDRALIAETETARQRDAAQRERLRAEKQTKVAQQATIEAENQKRIADTNYLTAKLERDKALKAQDAAVKASKEAEEQKNKAVALLETVNEIDRSAPYFKAIMRGHTGEVFQARFSPDGKLVITSSVDATSRVWDASTGLPKDIFPPKYLTGPGYMIISDSGRLVLLSASRGEVDIWDVEAKRQVASLEKGSTANYPARFSPNDRLFASTISRTNDARLSDVSTGKELRRLTGHTGQINDIVFSPNGKLLVTASDDASVRLWDVDTGYAVGVLRGHLKRVLRANFSPDGKFLVTASEDGAARVWDARTLESLTQLVAGDGKTVGSAIFSPDGKYILTTSGNSAFVWEAKSPSSWKELSDNSPTPLKGHTANVTDAVFSPDRKWIVTVSQDRTARVWEAKSAPANAPATSLATLAGHIKSVQSVDFSRDSKYVVTASEDKTARVWDLAGIGTFTVAKPALKAEPSEYTGKCPVTVKFTGTISVEGGSGTVKYKFVSNDGAPTLPQELSFDGPGSKEVSITRDVLTSLVRRDGTPLPIEGWVELQIGEQVTPIVFRIDMKSNRAAFNVNCSDSTSAPTNELTSAQLTQIMPNSTDQERALYLPHLQKAMEEFGINTPLRQAAFLAEVAYNTVDLRVITEKGTDEYLEKLYGSRKDLGNFQPGEGARYKGRGAFLLTGRSNYQAFGAQLGVDLVAYPERAASPEVAFRTAALYWQKNGLNELADRVAEVGDIVMIMRGISGPSSPHTNPSGLQQLEGYFERAKAALGVKAK